MVAPINNCYCLPSCVNFATYAWIDFRMGLARDWLTAFQSLSVSINLTQLIIRSLICLYDIIIHFVIAGTQHKLHLNCGLHTTILVRISLYEPKQKFSCWNNNFISQRNFESLTYDF